MYRFATIKDLQAIIIHIKIDTIPCINIKAKNVKGKHPPITVAGIVLKGQADLISIMVPLEVLV